MFGQISGADPWEEFHPDVGNVFSLDFGTVMILAGALVLLLWIPIRQRLGPGTISNVIALGQAANATMAVLQTPESLWLKAALIVAAVVLNALAIGPQIQLCLPWFRALPKAGPVAAK